MLCGGDDKITVVCVGGANKNQMRQIDDTRIEDTIFSPFLAGRTLINRQLVPIHCPVVSLADMNQFPLKLGGAQTPFSLVTYDVHERGTRQSPLLRRSSRVSSCSPPFAFEAPWFNTPQCKAAQNIRSTRFLEFFWK